MMKSLENRKHCDEVTGCCCMQDSEENGTKSCTTRETCNKSHDGTNVVRVQGSVVKCCSTRHEAELITSTDRSDDDYDEKEYDNNNNNNSISGNSSFQPALNFLMLYLPIVVVAVVAACVLYNHDNDDEAAASTASLSANQSIRRPLRRVLEDAISEESLVLNSDFEIDDEASMSPSMTSSFYYDNTSDIKPLFPLESSDYYGLLCACIGLMIAAGGGIGGGGILVPIFILVMKFSPRHAIPLSNVTIVGGAIANNLLNYRRRHPLADRPLIDWDLCMVMLPLTLLGALLGTFLNKILPELLLSILLVVLLSATSYTTLQKAVSMYSKETNQLLRQQKQQQELLDEAVCFKSASFTLETQTLLTANESGSEDSITDIDNDSDYSQSNKNSKREKVIRTKQNARINTTRTYSTISSSPDDDMNTIDKPNEIVQAILEQERFIPVTNVILLVVTLLIVLVVNLLKGGGAFHSPLGITCGSKEFWYANGFIVLWIGNVALYFRHHLVQRNNIKEENSYPFVSGDIKWDSTTTIVYPIVCCCAGFFAGMFGVGGGIITGPLMLTMGVHPEVNSATSACMILFTALTALTSFIVFGLVIPDYAILLFIVGFVATYIGHEVLSYMMKKSSRNSYIAFSIGAVVALSSLLMTIQSFSSLLSGSSSPSRGICSSK